MCMLIMDSVINKGEILQVFRIVEKKIPEKSGTGWDSNPPVVYRIMKVYKHVELNLLLQGRRQLFGVRGANSQVINYS